MTQEELTSFLKEGGLDVPVTQTEQEPILNPPAAQVAEKDVVPPVVEQEIPKELSDEELVALVQKRGLRLPTEKVLTEEERKAEEAKRKSDATAWGLQNGKFKIEEYNELTKAETRKIDLLVEEFEASLKKDNPEMSDEDIQNMIDSYTYSHLEDTDPVKIARQKELLELSSVRLKNKFRSIYNVEADYTAYIEEQGRISSEARQIEAAIPVYQSDVKNILSGFKSGKSVVIEDSKNPENTVTVNLSYSDEDIREIETHFLKTENAIDCVKRGYTQNDLKDGAELMLLKKHFERLVSQAAKEYNSVQKEKYLRGQKGIIPDRSLAGMEQTDKTKLDAFLANELEKGKQMGWEN